MNDEAIGEIKKNYVVGSGSSQAVEIVTDIVSKIINIRYINGMASPVKKIREILIDMAHPMDNYQNHEVGGGFVNIFVFFEYIEKLINGKIGSRTRRLWEKPINTTLMLDNLVTVCWLDNSYNDLINFTDEEIVSNEEKIKRYYEVENNHRSNYDKKSELGIY